MQNRMEMALTVDVKTDVAADAKTDAAADAGFPAAAAAAETAIRSLAVPERPVPAAAAEHIAGCLFLPARKRLFSYD